MRDAATQGRPDEVTTLLQGLSEDERKQLRRGLLRELRQRVTDLSRDRLLFAPDNVHIPPELMQIASTLGSVVGSRAVIPFSRGQQATKPRRERGEEFIACSLAVVGIGNQREVEALLFSRRMPTPWNEFQIPPSDRLWFRAGLVLAGRPEPWNRDVLRRIIEFDGGRSRRGTFANLPPLELGLHLVRIGVFTEDELLPALSRLARRTGF